MDKKIAPHLAVRNGSTIELNQDIIFTTPEGVEIAVVRCMGTIVANKSINYLMDVLHPDVYEANKEDITAEINQWGLQLIALATTHNVPLVAIEK